MLPTQSRDPDANLVKTFRLLARPNPTKTLAEGRPIFDDIEVCEIRRPGARDWMSYPADAHSHWQNDPFTGDQTQVTYAERFPRQYAQFKAQQQQTKSGTPLDYVPFLPESKRAELRTQNIYTVEQLAAIDGQELKNLGPYGRDLKNRAIEYIEMGKTRAPDMQLAAEMDALRARNQVLEEDNAALMKTGGEGQFREMTVDQIRDYITTQTGNTPVGNLSRKVLVRMAMDARPDKAA